MHSLTIKNLSQNKSVFEYLLINRSKEEQLYRPHAKKWCLLEIVCHLCDEEIEDFRTRVLHTLQFPGSMPPPIDPVAWVKTRKYMEQNYDTTVLKFLSERNKSILLLQELEKPDWKKAYQHPSLGKLTAEHFLFNWLGHDYLHIRQITGLLFNYTQLKTGNNLNYAGEW